MSSRSTSSAGPAGFTLIELLIAVAILGFVSLGIYQIVTRTYKLREVLSEEGEFYNTIQLAMGVIGRDVAMAYSPVIIAPPAPVDPNSPDGLPQPPGAADLSAIMADAEQSSKYWGAVLDRTGIRPGRFEGSEDALSFVASSNVRFYREARESAFLKVAYELKNDALAPDGLEGTRVLVRITDTNAFRTDEEREEFKRTYPLLQGIDTLKFSFHFMKDGKLQEVTRWDSEREEFKNRVPDMVQVRIKVSGKGRLEFEGTFKFRTEVPLNGLHPST